MKNNIVIVITFILCILTFSNYCFAGYYYSGISNTAPVAYINEMSAVFYEHPICERAVCHSIAWVTLWDKSVSNQYVEAGIGYSPRFNCPVNKSIGLWWATKQFPYGEKIACVKKGTLVNVGIIKLQKKEQVLISWKYGLFKHSVVVNTPNWINKPGIHPTKLEVYSNNNIAPSPVHAIIYPMPLFIQDTQIIYEQSYPYIPIWKNNIFEIYYK